MSLPNEVPPELARLLEMWDSARPDWRRNPPWVHLLPPGQCSYLKERQWRLALVRHSDLNLVLEMGGQRFGEFFCLPACHGCRACVPARLRLDDFRFSRSQRRTLRRNRDLEVELGPVEYTPEKFALLESFLVRRFGLDYAEFRDPARQPDFYRRWMLFEGGGTLEFRYRYQGRLVGLGAVDPAPGAAYSHFFLYDIDYPRRRLGVYSFLREVEWCLETGRRYLYVGFYNDLCRSMRYKRDLGPLDLLLPGRGWVSFSEAEGPSPPV